MSRDNADGASMGFRSSDEFNNWLKDAPKVDERNAAAPTPPVQDDAKDARIAELERLAEAISSDCNAVANERNALQAELAAYKAQEGK